MTDPLSLFVSIGSQLRAATDIAIGLGKLHTMAEVNAKAIELQGAILSLQSDAFAAQAQQSSMIQRIRDLEEEIRQVKAWEETKQRYSLYEPIPGSFVYASKENSGSPEPSHWICANCYEDNKRSILQLKRTGDIDQYGCPHCFSEVLAKGTSKNSGFGTAPITRG